MKVLSIGSDRELFKPGSDVAKRILEQSRALDELRIVIFSKRGFSRTQLSDRVWLYPTNSWTRWLYVWDAYRLIKMLSRPDLVTAQDPFECGLAGWLAARRHQTELELQVHTDFLSSYFVYRSPLNRVRVLLARFLLSRADKIRVVSERIKVSLVAKNWPLRTLPTVRPVVIDLEKLKSEPIKSDLRKKYPQFNKRILMASRLAWEKNISSAIGAMTQVVKQNPEVGLIIVGSGPELECLKRQVLDSNLEGNVIFESWIDDLASYYKTADLFLNTSFYEGYGRTIVEAQACGLVVLSTDVGVAREVGVQLVGFTAKDIADGLLEALKR